MWNEVFTGCLAYIGPGAGLGLGGAVLGVLLALLTAFAFVLVWPLRALYRKLRGGSTEMQASEADANRTAATIPAEHSPAN